jgi:hypothetical protein
VSRVDATENLFGTFKGLEDDRGQKQPACWHFDGHPVVLFFSHLTPKSDGSRGNARPTKLLSAKILKMHAAASRAILARRMQVDLCTACEPTGWDRRSQALLRP